MLLPVISPSLTTFPFVYQVPTQEITNLTTYHLHTDTALSLPGQDNLEIHFQISQKDLTISFSRVYKPIYLFGPPTSYIVLSS